MSAGPVIAFGQQPCGFFPRRFLYSKIVTARRLQQELGGEIVFFYHDSDHDPRETKTTLRNRKTADPHTLNFTFENKVQKKFVPLYLKRVSREWQESMARQLPVYVDPSLVGEFKQVTANNVADFCLEMYARMGLLEGIRVVRSSDPEVRRDACEISDYFADVEYEEEIVRARMMSGVPCLHEGGDKFIRLRECKVSKHQISPTRDSRLLWMQSVIKCTHYVSGAGEQAYLNLEEAPEITFVKRDPIERSDEAYAQPRP